MSLPNQHILLILASASPRRLALLKQALIIPDEVIASNLDEIRQKNEDLKSFSKRLAIEKAQKIHNDPKYANYYVLGADTVVACGRNSLEKAETESQARRFLTLLSGRRHKVYGGIAVITPEGKIVSRVCETTVQFKKLGPREIDNYIATGEWEGKAGGYAIQGYAACFVKFISGSYSNVVGLSLYDTMQILDGVGFKRKGS